MARLGADPEDLDRLADQLAAGKVSLSNARSGLGGRLNSTYWSGPDAENFRGWWSRSGSPYLNSASYYMGSLADYVKEQASEQRWASRGAGYRLSWPGRPPQWNDPINPSIRRGPSGPRGFSNDGGGYQGDPVDSATGALWFTESDGALVSPGGFVLELERTHHSWFDDSLSFGHGWVSFLDSHVVRSGDRLGVLAPDGAFLQFVESDGAFAPIVGVTATLDQSAAGFRLTSADGQILSYGASGKLERVGTATDLGFTLTATAGRVDSIQSSDGHITPVVRDDEGRIVAIGDLCSFEYDDSGNMVEASNDEGTARYEWDERHRVTRQWDRRGRTVVQTEFGSDGRVACQLDPRDAEYLYTWDEDSGRSVMIDPLGHEWTDRYVDGLLVERTNPLGFGVRYEKDGPTTVAEIGPDGIRRSTIVDELSGVDVADGRLSRLGDLSFDYDELGQLISLQEGESRAVITRDPEQPSRILKVSDSSGEEVMYTYDDDGRLVGLEGPNGRVEFEFEDEALRSVDLQTDGSHLRVWTENGTIHRDVDGVTSVVAASDDLGRVGQIFDESGRARGFSYDDWDRLTTVTAPNGDQTSYSYDTFDRVSGRIDAAERQLRIERDAAQRLIGVETEDGAHFAFDLDAMGRIVGITTGEHGELVYERDELGNVVSVAGTGITRELSYEDGSLTSLSSNEDQLALFYDDAGRVVSLESDRTGPIAFEYAPDGSVTAKTIGGVRTEIGYLGSLEGSYSSPVGEVVVDVDSDDALTLRLPNGVRSTATWSGARLASLEARGPNGVLWSERYEIDPVGNVSSIELLDGRWGFEYDSRDMITAARLDGDESRELSWRWNAVGTRLEKTVDGVAHISELDEHARVSAIESTAEQRHISYDDGGRVTQSGVWHYQYDGEGNLIEARGPSTTIRHSYDAFSNRVRTVEADLNGSIVRDVSIGWDLSTVLPEPVLAVNNLTGRREIYQYGPMGAPLCVFPADAPDEVRWFVTDPHGTIRMVTDTEGNVTGSRLYDPFGSVLSENGEFNTGLLQLGYLGAMQEVSSGLIHLRERDYDPELGRFLAPDPELMPIGMSVITGYAYAFNRPVALSDPSGLWPGEGLYNKAREVGGAAIDKVRDVGGAVVERTGDIVGGAVRSAGGFVRTSVQAVSTGASALWNGATSVASFVYRNADTIGAVLGTAAIAATVLAATVFTGGAALPFIAGVLTAGAQAMFIVSMFRDGSQFLAGILAGDMSMMFEGFVGLMLSGLSMLIPPARVGLPWLYRAIRSVNPSVPVWLVRSLIIDLAEGIGRAVADWIGVLIQTVVSDFLDRDAVPVSPKVL